MPALGVLEGEFVPDDDWLNQKHYGQTELTEEERKRKLKKNILKTEKEKEEDYKSIERKINGLTLFQSYNIYKTNTFSTPFLQTDSLKKAFLTPVKLSSDEFSNFKFSIAAREFVWLILSIKENKLDIDKEIKKYEIYEKTISDYMKDFNKELEKKNDVEKQNDVEEIINFYMMFLKVYRYFLLKEMKEMSETNLNAFLEKYIDIFYNNRSIIDTNEDQVFVDAFNNATKVIFKKIKKANSWFKGGKSKQKSKRKTKSKKLRKRRKSSKLKRKSKK